MVTVRQIGVADAGAQPRDGRFTAGFTRSVGNPGRGVTLVLTNVYKVNGALSTL
jgi:hypothetical protein